MLPVLFVAIGCALASATVVVPRGTTACGSTHAPLALVESPTEEVVYSFSMAQSLEADTRGRIRSTKRPAEHISTAPFATISGVVRFAPLCDSRGPEGKAGKDGGGERHHTLVATLSNVRVYCNESRASKRSTKGNTGTTECRDHWLPLAAELPRHPFWFHRNESGGVDMKRGVVFAQADTPGSATLKKALVEELSLPTLCETAAASTPVGVYPPGRNSQVRVEEGCVHLESDREA